MGDKAVLRECAFISDAHGRPGKYDPDSQLIVLLGVDEEPTRLAWHGGKDSRGFAWYEVGLPAISGSGRGAKLQGTICAAWFIMVLPYDL